MSSKAEKDEKEGYISRNKGTNFGKSSRAKLLTLIITYLRFFKARAMESSSRVQNWKYTNFSKYLVIYELHLKDWPISKDGVAVIGCSPITL